MGFCQEFTKPQVDICKAKKFAEEASLTLMEALRNKLALQEVVLFCLFVLLVLNLLHSLFACSNIAATASVIR